MNGTSVTTFEAFHVGQRVRYISIEPETEPIGTITEVSLPSQHLTITWDDDHKPSSVDALEAMRKLEIV